MEDDKHYFKSSWDKKPNDYFNQEFSGDELLRKRREQADAWFMLNRRNLKICSAGEWEECPGYDTLKSHIVFEDGSQGNAHLHFFARKAQIAASEFMTIAKYYTDYPFTELGDTPGCSAPIREVKILSYDGDKYCIVEINGHELTVKAGYIFKKCALTRDEINKFCTITS